MDTLTLIGCHDADGFPHCVLVINTMTNSWLDWKAYKVETWTGSHESRAPQRVKPFADGYLKEDGCLEFDVNQLHLCSEDLLGLVSDTLRLVYQAGAKHLPGWDPI